MPALPTFPLRRAVLAGLVALASAAAGGCGEAARSSTTSLAPTATPTVPAQPPAAAATPPGTTPSGDPLEATSSGQVVAMQAAALVEACFGARPDYRLCTRPQAVGGAAALPIVDGTPNAGEVQILADGPRSFSVVGADADGTRWTIRRAADGEVSRSCETPTGRACGPSAWASPAS